MSHTQAHAEDTAAPCSEWSWLASAQSRAWARPRATISSTVASLAGAIAYLNHSAESMGSSLPFPRPGWMMSSSAKAASSTLGSAVDWKHDLPPLDIDKGAAKVDVACVVEGNGLIILSVKE